MKTKWYFSLVCVFFTLIFLMISNQSAFPQPPGAISGTVTDQNGPLANIQVSVNGKGWGYGGCTNADGSYTISGISPGDYRVSVGGASCNNGPVYAQVFYINANTTTPNWNAAAIFTLSSGLTLPNIDFSGLVLGTTVSGLVTDQNGPLANVQVNVGGNGWGYGGCTNATGNYTISGIFPGDYRISAGGSSCNNGPVYAQVFYINANTTTPNWDAATTFTLNSEHPQSGINFSGLVLGATVSGKVTTANGTPLANVQVNVNNSNQGYGRCTDSSGVYTISGIAQGTDYRVSVGGSSCNNEPVYAQVFYINANTTTPNWNAATTFTLGSGQTQSDINFSGLVLGATVSGLVTGQNGPLANVQVSVNGNGWGYGRCTNADGSYTISGISPGDYRVSAGGSSCNNGPIYDHVYYVGANTTTPNWNAAAIFTLSSGLTQPNIDFSGLVLGATVSGKVTAANGTPLANVQVNVNNSNQGYGGCTNADGSYTISGISPGDYRVSAGGSSCNNGPIYGYVYYVGVNNTTPNYNSAAIFTLSSGNTLPNINFSDLVQIAAISVNLTGDSSIGVQGLNVVLHDVQGPLIYYYTTSQSGTCFFGNLAPGNYTIKVYDPFLNYLYAERGPLQVSLGTVINSNITLTKLVPSGSNLPSFKTLPQVFVYRTADAQESVNLSAEINDPSGCQPPSIKSVTVVDPAGQLHYLYHEKNQALIDQRTSYGESWQNNRDNALSNFTTLVGNYTFTVVDMEGNRVPTIVNLGSYSHNKLPLPILIKPTNMSQVDLTNLTLSWNPVAGAARYQVRIFEMGERIFKGNNQTATSFNVPATVPSGLLSPGRWYSWQVIAMDNADSNNVDYRSNSSTINFYTTGGPISSPQPLNVKIVPWVSGSSSIPHDAYAGHSISVKAVGKGGTPPYKYTWDFGDGTPLVTGTSSLNLGAKHLYSAASDTIFDARITVTDGAGASVSAVYPVKFWANPSRGVKVNAAIDEALWWFHNSLVLFTSGGTDYGYLSPGSYPAGTTALALQAFILNGHKPDGDPNDPYTEDALRAKNFLLTQLFPICIGPETIAGNTRNPDSNGNGRGLYVKNGHRLYETGLVLMALSTLKDSNLKETVQDIVDYLAYAQVEPDAGGGRGGWRYDTNYRESDMSVTQFPLLGLEAAEYHMGSMGVTIPPYVKNELKNNFLYFVQNKELGGSNFGGFGYSWPNSWVNVAKTGAGVVGMALTGFPFNDPRVTGALQFIDQHWYQAENDPQSNNPAYNIGDLYAMYAVMKGMKSFEIRGANTTHISGHDWYDEYAQWEILNQQDNGTWQSPVNSYGQYVDTAFGVLLLLPQVFDIGPTAVAQASPTQLEAWQSVTFSHSGSFHMDKSKSIVRYDWDFNGDGVADWTTTSLTATQTYRYTAPGTYTAILKVTDNAGLVGTDRVTIVVTASTSAPVTIKIEPETFNLGAKGVFTASITLPENSSYSLSNIDTSSLRCEGAPVVNTNVAAKKLIAKFNVQDLKGVPAGDKVTLTVIGNFKDGRPFKGSDTVKVLSK